MDLITDLPKAGKYDTILTIVDQGCSKATKFIPCQKTITREEVARLYLKHLLPWFGIPKRIISDRDPHFMSQFARAICKDLGINQNLSTAFHPRTDGQTECMNAWIKQYLHPWTIGQQNDWATYLPMAEFAHNSWKHDVTHKSPHELLMGFSPQVHVKFQQENVPSTHNQLKSLEESRTVAQKLLEKIQTT